MNLGGAFGRYSRSTQDAERTSAQANDVRRFASTSLLREPLRSLRTEKLAGQTHADRAEFLFQK